MPNVIEGHLLAIHRVTRYYDLGETSGYDSGMEPIDGSVDIDSSLEMETLPDAVYATGSQLLLDNDRKGEPIVLVKEQQVERRYPGTEAYQITT